MRAGSFSPGLELDAGGDVDDAGAGGPDGIGHVVGGEAAGEDVGHVLLDAAEHAPIEGGAVPAGARRALRGAGVEQDVVDHGAVVQSETRVGGAGHLDGLDDRQVPAAADGNGPFGGLLAVQLQHVRLDQLHNGLDERVFRIDQQSHHLGAAARLGGERLCVRRVDAARLGGKNTTPT